MWLCTLHFANNLFSHRYIAGSPYAHVTICGDVMGPAFPGDEPVILERLFPTGHGRFGKGTEYHAFNLAANTWQLHYFRWLKLTCIFRQTANPFQNFVCLNLYEDQVAEWLRRWTANPMGSARVSSNLILVVKLFKLIYRFGIFLTYFEVIQTIESLRLTNYFPS